MAEYDNSNRASLWKVLAASGPGEIGGIKVRCHLRTTGLTGEHLPQAILDIVPADETRGVGLFDHNKSLYSSSITWQGQDYWVNVYKNEKGGENAPALNIQFKPKTAQAAPPPAPTTEAPPSEDCPF